MVIYAILAYTFFILITAALLSDGFHGVIEQPWRGILSLLGGVIWPISLVAIILVGVFVVIFERD